jgi:hypothetical protein
LGEPGRATGSVGVLSSATVPEPENGRKHAEWAKDFYLKEYECLRKEIEWLLKDYRDLEFFVRVRTFDISSGFVISLRNSITR